MEATGSYFGLWTLATKLNLALAAGIALPVLSALGYAPGGRNQTALGALAFVYAFVPCVLKLAACAALVWFKRSHEEPIVRSKFEGGAGSESSSDLAGYATGDLMLGFRKR